MGGDPVDRRQDRLHERGSLRRWVQQAERDEGKRAGLRTSDRERMKQLERENLELKRANEILRTASAHFAQAELDRRRK
jgi:transposase-like protein